MKKTLATLLLTFSLPLVAAPCQTQIVIIDGQTYACFICPRFTQCDRT